jgi:hypothetical protein
MTEPKRIQLHRAPHLRNGPFDMWAVVYGGTWLGRPP